MPTILTHPAATLARPWFGALPRRVVLAGAIATILPDADVAAFAFGIPYGATFGHRGFTHSILFALIVAIASIPLLRPPRPARAFAFVFICAMSHPVLDALTTGGLGVAFFSPFSNERYFFPWRPIRVSPIGPRFFSARGLAVLASELMWVWLPLTGVWAAGRLLRGKKLAEVDGEGGEKG